MLEWLVLLAGTLLFIINLTDRERLTNPTPSGHADATIVLPQGLQDKLASYKTLLAASTMNPKDSAAAQATAAAKTQIDTELVGVQQEIANMQSDIQKTIGDEAGLGSDIDSLHKQVTSYSTTLPTLKDNLTKAEVIAAEKVHDTSVMLAKAVAICVIGVFAVFVQGVY